MTLNWIHIQNIIHVYDAENYNEDNSYFIAVSENEALELFANIQKTSDSLKGELKTAALQVKGVISVIGLYLNLKPDCIDKYFYSK